MEELSQREQSLAALDESYVHSVCHTRIRHICTELDGTDGKQAGYMTFRKGNIRLALVIETFTDNDQRYANIALLRVSDQILCGPLKSICIAPLSIYTDLHKSVGDRFRVGENIALLEDHSVEVVTCANRLATDKFNIELSALRLVETVFGLNGNRSQRLMQPEPTPRSFEVVVDQSSLIRIREALLGLLSENISKEAIIRRAERLTLLGEFISDEIREGIIQLRLSHPFISLLLREDPRQNMSWWIERGLLPPFSSNGNSITCLDLLVQYKGNLRRSRDLIKTSLFIGMRGLHFLAAFRDASKTPEPVSSHLAKYTLAFTLIRWVNRSYDLETLLASNKLESFDAELTSIRYWTFGQTMNPQWYMMEGLFKYYALSNPSVPEEVLFERLPEWLRHMIAFSRIHTLASFETDKVTEESREVILSKYAETFLQRTYDDPHIVGKLIRVINVEFRVAEHYFDHLIYLGLMKGPKFVEETFDTLESSTPREKSKDLTDISSRDGIADQEIDTNEITMTGPGTEAASSTQTEEELFTATKTPVEFDIIEKEENDNKGKRKKALKITLGLAAAGVIIAGGYIIGRRYLNRKRK